MLAIATLAPAERAAWARLPAEARLPAFYDAWTAKEAWLKATGEGLMRAPVEVDRERAADGRAVPVVAGVPARGWRIWSFAPAPGYLGALAAPGDDWRPVGWDWTPDDVMHDA